MTVAVTAQGEAGAALEQEADEAIETFDAWFREELGNEPMTKSERAILKTFIWWGVQAGRKGDVRPTVSPPTQLPPSRGG